MARERDLNAFVGRDGNGEEMFYYPIDDVLMMLRMSGARSFQMDMMNRVIFFGNREDFHRFMIASGFAYGQHEGGEEEFDPDGVILPNIPEENLAKLRKPDVSGYGMPWQIYSVFFRMGMYDPWEVRANHRIARPEPKQAAEE